MHAGHVGDRERNQAAAQRMDRDAGASIASSALGLTPRASKLADCHFSSQVVKRKVNISECNACRIDSASGLTRAVTAVHE